MQVSLHLYHITTAKLVNPESPLERKNRAVVSTTRFKAFFLIFSYLMSC